MEMINQKEEAGDEIWKKYLPPGFRFCPDMDELFDYLKKRVFRQPIFSGIIQECDVYECQPSHLSGYKRDVKGNKSAYFFTHTDKVNPNPNAKNQKRTTRDDKGTWKATTVPFIHEDGKKNTLVYHLKNDRSKLLEKTNWIMHEFVLHDYSNVPNDQDKNLVLCYIYDRNKKSTRNENQESFVTEEENMINNDEVKANPRPIRSLKRKGDGTIDQTLQMREELGINHHKCYNEPGPSEPKMPIYSPIPYTKPVLHPVHNLKSKGDGTIDQTLHMCEEFVTNHHKYYNEPGPSEPKMPMYSPIPYTEPVRSLKSKEYDTIDQTLDMREEFVTNHHKYYNEPGPSEPKTPMYSPIPYTEPGTTSTCFSSFDAALSDVVPSCSFANQSPSDKDLMDSFMDLVMESSSYWSLISLEELQPQQQTGMQPKAKFI